MFSFVNLLNFLISSVSNSVLANFSINCFCSRDNFLGVYTLNTIYISPFLRRYSLFTPLPLILCLSPLLVHAEIFTFTLSYSVGISFLQPNIASVNVSGTSR